jgi:predicted DNA-binding ArsR family transcriptional regulator
MPDDASAAILSAYARRGERAGSVLRRALLLLARADGVLDTRGRVPRQGRRP